MQLFCDYGLSSVPTKRKQAVMQPITCAFAPQSAIGKLATIRNRKKVAKMSRFLFLDSRSGFGMTIWSGRTQLSIMISFAAAPVSGNRTLHSVVSWAGGAYCTVRCRSGGAYRTAWRLPWAPPRPPPPIDPSPFAKKSKPAVHKAFTIDGTQLRSCLKIEAFA